MYNEIKQTVNHGNKFYQKERNKKKCKVITLLQTACFNYTFYIWKSYYNHILFN